MLKKIFNSRNVLIIIILFTALQSYNYKRWQSLSIIHDDAINYYAYLPAAFIYHDLTFSFMDSLPPNSGVKIYRTKNADNRDVQKMTVGESLMILPFFYPAHLYATAHNFRANGYSEPYEFAIVFAAFFYFVLGLIFLRKTLKFFFDDNVISVVLLVIALATNLFFYSSYESGMSHAYSFCLFSIFLWAMIKWHNEPSLIFSIIIGLILGMITLMRPVNCLVFVFFILYAVIDKKTFYEKLFFVRRNWLKYLLIGMTVFIPVSVQLMYWKFATGHWVYYSYGSERFYFNNPHIWEGLFGFRKGFFVYTPAMIFILPGIYVAYKQKEKFAFAFIIFFLINIYVMFSWWCWWYGGGFGCRPMVDFYAILALPLGAFIAKCFKGNWAIKSLVIVFTALLIKLNLFQIEQVKSTILHWDSMNAKTYFKIFGKKGPPENYSIMLTSTDAENAYKGLPEREVFDLSEIYLTLKYSHKVFIKGSNNRFVCDDISKNGAIICNRENGFEWETFWLKKFNGNYCTLQTFENKYAGIDLTRDSKLFATKTIAEKTEIFKMEDLNNNKFALKACNGTYITWNKKDSVLIAGATKITEAETFELISK